MFNQIYIVYRHSSVAAADEFEKFAYMLHLSLPHARAFSWASLHACRLARLNLSVYRNHKLKC